MTRATLGDLNTAQRRAVMTIDGPLLVLAGPGTGKTTLLTHRTAQILQVTDILPSNVLCLTFTDSAQRTMQERLSQLLGDDAYKVHVHTFHGFGGWMMRTYPEHFRFCTGYKPADDVRQYQIYESIFVRLAHGNILASMNDGEFVYLKDAMTRIGQLKQAGVTPEALMEECKINQHWIASCNKLLQKELGALKLINLAALPAFQQLFESLPTNDPSALGVQFTTELAAALQNSLAGAKPSTKPLTAWKNTWLTKTSDGHYITKATRETEKLRALADIYRDYQESMKRSRLVDYDDLLMNALHALQTDQELRAEIQEQFIYIMVDEYQDTNGVQQQILETIADNPVHEDRPNIMVVGDDDQAIYGFQGAYSSNVLEFLNRWRDVQTVVLTENYRSSPQIVKLARSVITQGANRLEDVHDYISKELTTPNPAGGPVRNLRCRSEAASLHQVASEISARIQSGQDPQTIAVLAPRHAHLEALVPHLATQHVSTHYERRQDVLDQPHVSELLLLAEVIDLLSSQEFTAANQRMPQLLSLPWWGLQPLDIWQISLAASRERTSWLEIMQKSPLPALADIAHWLIEQSVSASSTPLEVMLDQLMGGEVATTVFDSPYRRYYFDTSNPSSYADLLASLITIRRHVRDYSADRALLLSDFIAYIDLRRSAGLHITNDHPAVTGTSAVQLLTAHKAKGMEFDTVYILKTEQSGWANNRARKNLIGLPPYIAKVPSGESEDEKLRLFYVAITRAIRDLTFVSYQADDQAKQSLPLGWLTDANVVDQLTLSESTNDAPEATIQSLHMEWYGRHLMPQAQTEWRAVLHDSLQSYALSPTHLNAFLDVTRGGPQSFLLNQLLRFPHALGPNASFGNAMHTVMEYMHNQLNEHHSLPNAKQVIALFDTEIAGYHLGDIETPKQTTRGHSAISSIYEHASHIFTGSQTPERDFAREEVRLGEARLKGKIDAMVINKEGKTIQITDYKTGKPTLSWPRPNARDYDALKLHKYRQQLLFYKLLVEHSRSYAGYIADHARLVFLEHHDEQPGILQLTYDDAELERFKLLIKVVWAKIINLDLPDISKYPQDISGVLQFEDDLLSDYS